MPPDLRLHIAAGTQLSPARLVIPVTHAYFDAPGCEPGAAPIEFERRAARRSDVDALLAVIQPSVVSTLPPRTTPVRIKNVSTGGALLVSAMPIVSHRMWLRWSTVGDGMFDECVLVRRDVQPAATSLDLGFVCGVRFIKPLSTTRLQLIVDRLKGRRLNS